MLFNPSASRGVGRARSRAARRAGAWPLAPSLPAARRTRRRWAAASGLAALGSAAAARPAPAQTDYYNTDAGRPVDVEDAYPVERRAVELQVAPLRLSRGLGGAYRWGLEPEVAVGVLPRTQVEVAVPLAVVDDGDGRGAAGVAGVEIGVLHNLNAETAIPALAVAGELLLPAGGLGPERAYASVKGIATRTLPWARFHLNAQYTAGGAPGGPSGSPRAELSRWVAGAAVDRTFPLEALLVTGEVVARRPLAADAAPRPAVEWSAGGGARYQVSPRVAADGGAGYRMTGDDRGWYVTAGAAVAVGLPWRAR